MQGVRPGDIPHAWYEQGCMNAISIDIVLLKRLLPIGYLQL